jgi:hypothetical protein
MKDAFGVERVSKAKRLPRKVLKEIGSNASSYGYSKAKKKSKVSKAVKLPDGSWVRLRALRVKSSIPPHAHVENHVGATRKSKRVGTLMQFRDDGMVGGVGVEEGLRRKGIATAMWNRAEKAGWNPKHSSTRTPDGEAWATTVGGHLPKNSY